MWGRPTRAPGFELVPVDDDEQTWLHRQRIPAAASRWAARRRALDVLALTGRVDEARARARGDGAAAIRAWQPPAELSPPPQPSLLD